MRMAWIVPVLCIAGAANAQSTIVTRWNFNVPGASGQNPFGGTVLPNIGNGEVRYIGTCATAPNGDPIEPMFRAGSSADGAPASDNAALDMSPFPAQGQGSGSSGAEFSVPTVSYSNIVVQWEHRHSNRSPKHAQFQYSLDGVTFTTVGLENQPTAGANAVFTAPNGDTWYSRTIDLTGIAGVNNNPNFKFRIVGVFAPGTDEYQQTTGTGWDVDGRYRYDVVTVRSLSGSSDLSATARGNPRGAISGGTGSTTFLTTVIPGANPTSTGITATVDLSQVGGPAAQPMFDNGTNGDAQAGDNRFSFLYTVPASVAPGSYTLPVTVRDDQNRQANPNINLRVVTPQPANSTVVISQLFGAGGAFGAMYNSDFVELFNRSQSAVDISGWSLQGAPDGGDFTSERQIIFPGGTIIPPGGYFLVQLSPATGTWGLPLIPDYIGVPGFGIGQLDGKVALVKNSQIVSTCPNDVGGDPTIADLVGYGHNTNCYFGVSSTVNTSILAGATRKDNGCQDTRQNFHDFLIIAPNPRGSYTPPNVCTPSCPADFNGDGQVDFFDYLDFVQAFASDDPSADFNGDGQVDFFDYLDFVIAYDAGC